MVHKEQNIAYQFEYIQCLQSMCTKYICQYAANENYCNTEPLNHGP